MRPNSFPIRSSRESLDPSTSLPDDDEANGVSTTHCCDSGDAGVSIVPDTFDERNVPHKKRHCLGIIELDRGGSSMEPLNFDSCIVCEISDKKVSRCSGIDCLLSFHRECVYAELGSSSSEHLANPYCPYCWLKILALKSNSLREKTVGAEKAVFKYLDKEMKSRDEDTTLSGDENGNQEQQHSMDRVTENFQDAEDNETAKDQTKVSNGAGKKGDVSPFLSMQESFSGNEQEQVQQNEKPRRKRRRLIQINSDSETSSKESSNERNGDNVTEQISLSAQVTSPSGMMKNQQRPTKVVVAKPKTVRDISFFKDQRRKLFWTLEEEEMLKVGVEIYSAKAKKNMPWRKILEMGEKVFHETRTPSDLKDKWRNMVGARTVTSSK